jgi:thiaminase/transcriptional activator TenA
LDSASKFSESLVAANKSTWDALASHPWVKALADGTLPEEALVAWAQQDRLYLMHEHQALLALRSKLFPFEELGSPLESKIEKIMASLGEDLIREPRQLGETLKSLGAPLVDEPWPITLGYGSFVITACQNGLHEGLAAAYASEKAYLDTWTAVLPSVEKDSKYYQWVNNWTQDAFRQVVDQMGECVDELAGPSPSENTARRMHSAFRGAARFELAFWEMSWKQQGWPTPLQQEDQ